MKILSYDVFLDGGTVEVVTDNGTYYIDGRIETWDSDNPHEIYDRDPDEEGAIIVNPNVNDELIKAFETYHDQSDYVKGIAESIKR